MKFNLLVLYSFSIGIAAIIGAVRYTKINPAYYPFIYLCWLAILNETLSYILVSAGHSNSINNNIYVLLESILITLQFRNWGLFRNKRMLLYTLLCFFILTWFIDAFLIGSINQLTTYFRILSAFLTVLMSIQVSSKIMMREREQILRNSTFLICIAFIIFFTFSVFVELFLLWGIGATREFRISILMILIYLNVFANLIYALAVLWMPNRLPFTMPS